jgi:ribosomal protein S4
MFYFLKTKIKNRLYHIYKIFFSEHKKYFVKRHFYVPFIYEPRIYNVVHRRIKKGAEYLSLQLVRLFYIIYTFKQLRQLIKKAKRSDDVFEVKFLLLMECKLPSFIYRSSFFSNMFESINFIKSGNL